ncbi:unnamed protein product, partial [Ectocarpus sp. 12 AP-2014]
KGGSVALLWTRPLSFCGPGCSRASAGVQAATCCGGSGLSRMPPG